MRGYIKYTVLAFSLIPLFISAAAMAGEYSPASGGGGYGSAFQASTGNAPMDGEIDYTQIIEDTDIMAKIIDDALEKRWPKKYEPSTLFRQSIGCQGIYLKGYGAVFMTNINFPVAEREVQQQEEPPTDDLWEQTRRELNSLPQAGAFSEGTFSYVAPGTEDYDAKRLGALKEELLRLIGEYGANIRQLGPQESVVIVVRGMPGDALVLTTTGYYNDYEKPDESALKALEVKLKRNEEMLKQYNEALNQKVLNQNKEIIETLKNKIDKTPGLDGTINYELMTPSEVTVQIEDLDGNIVRTIEQGEQEAGEKGYHWDGKDDQGKGMGAGIYNYTVQAGDNISTGKIMLTKQPKSGTRRRAVAGSIPSSKPAVEVWEKQAAVPEDAPSASVDVLEASPAVPNMVVVEMMNEKDGASDVITRVFRTTSGLASGNSVSGRTTLIVKVSRESIMQYKDGSLEFEDFANMAEVTQY